MFKLRAQWKRMLAQVPDMRVAARTSSFAYQGTNTAIATIAEELGVGAVLEGSVQRSGDKMRIIAQLIHASDQTHLWSQTFDRTAYEHYLRAKEGYEQATSESTEMALRELQAALLIDPQYVPALVQIGLTYMQLNSVSPRTWAEIEPLADAALRRAVDLAPDDPIVVAAIANLVRLSPGDKSH